MVFWKASFCELFKNKLVSLLVSLRTTSEPLLQLTSSCYEYAQYFWRSQECPLFQVSHLCPCPIGQAWGSSSSSESLCSGRRASSGEGALTHQPGPWAGWWEGRAWGALQQGPLAQSKCSQVSRSGSPLQRAWGSCRSSFTASLLVCSVSQQSSTSM